jgi:head-tail adaptor
MAQQRPYIGQMDRKVKVYKKSHANDEMGVPVETLDLVCEPWAQMRDTSGHQVVEGAPMSVVDRSYVIRRYPEIAKNGRLMVVRDADVDYEVHSLKEIGRSHIELLVQVIQNNK